MQLLTFCGDISANTINGKVIIPTDATKIASDKLRIGINPTLLKSTSLWSK